MPDVVSAFANIASTVDTILGDALAPYALFSQQGRMIGEIAIDVPIREVLDDTWTATQHPTENGTPIADHYFKSPAQLEMTCGFSDSTAGYEGYVQQVYAAFLALAATRTPFDVSTGKRQYSNLVIVGLQAPTDAQSEYALFLIVRLQEVFIAQTSTSTMDNSRMANPASTSATVDYGQQALKSGPEGALSFSDYMAQFNSPVKTPTGTGGIGSA